MRELSLQVCLKTALIKFWLSNFECDRFLYITRIFLALAAYTNTLIFLWTTIRADLRNTEKYQTVFNSGGTLNGLVTVTTNVINHYNWKEVGFVFTTTKSTTENIPFCNDYARYLVRILKTSFEKNYGQALHIWHKLFYRVLKYD
jgi:hypothetical protein